MITFLVGNKKFGRLVTNRNWTLEEALEMIGYGVDEEGARRAYEDGVPAAYIDDDGIPAIDLNVIRIVEAEEEPTDEALSLAEEIRTAREWEPEKCCRLCEMAGMAEEYATAGGEGFEAVLYEAAEKLGVEI